jgi:hypothetical protein
MSDDMKTENADEPAVDSGPPADWAKAKAVLSRALAFTAWSIRRKNRAAQANGGTRVPL